MTLFHVDASVINKGKSQGGGAGFARYLTGELPGNATRMQQYLERDQSGRDDLVASGAEALPAWAKDGAHFFAMADRYERQGGVVARHYQITLPRELSERGRLELAEDIRRAFFERYPSVWAIHNPMAKDGSGEQPHLHVMFSPRREDVTYERTPKQWFARAVNEGLDPSDGGVRKDRSWDRKIQLQAVRAETATLINAALEREGIPAAVSQERLGVRGLGRSGLYYLPGAREALKQRVAENRAQLHPDERMLENESNRLAWEQQKPQEGIRDLSREAIVDHVRDRFWLHDRSPAREAERQASVERLIAREYTHTGREYVPVDRQEYTQEHALDRQWTKPLIGHKRSHVYHTPEQAQYGEVNPKHQQWFWSEREAQEAGFQRAEEPVEQQPPRARDLPRPRPSQEHAWGRAARSRIFEEEREMER